MPRPSKISAEDWNGPIREAFESDTRPDAVNHIATRWELTARRIRQVASEKGWMRPQGIDDAPVPSPSPDADPQGRKPPRAARKPSRPQPEHTLKAMDAIKLPKKALAKAKPGDLAASGLDTHRNAPPAPEKKGRKVIDQIQAAQEDASRNLDVRSPPGARAAAYAAVALDPTQSLETYRMMVTQQVERTVALGNIFTMMTGLIQTVVAPVDPNDMEGQQRRTDATLSLFPGRTDSLAGVLTATRQLAEVLRAHEAGMMDVHVEAARRRAAQEIEAKEAGGASKSDDDIAFELLPLEEQLRLMEAALLLDNNRIAPDFPVPPTGPVIEHPPVAPEAPTET